VNQQRSSSTVSVFLGQSTALGLFGPKYIYALNGSTLTMNHYDTLLGRVFKSKYNDTVTIEKEHVEKMIELIKSHDQTRDEINRIAKDMRSL
jgi:hypothetical protein